MIRAPEVTPAKPTLKKQVISQELNYQHFMSKIQTMQVKSLFGGSSWLDRVDIVMLYDRLAGKTELSHKESFFNSKNTNMNFGHALEYAKYGDKITRAKWNKKIVISLEKGAYDPASILAALPKDLGNVKIDVSVAEVRGLPKKYFGTVSGLNEKVIMPTLTFVNNKSNTVAAYVPSQEDMLAEDWQRIHKEMPGSNDCQAAQLKGFRS